jgi:hypothetical protein
LEEPEVQGIGLQEIELVRGRTLPRVPEPMTGLPGVEEIEEWLGLEEERHGNEGEMRRQGEPEWASKATLIVRLARPEHALSPEGQYSPDSRAALRPIRVAAYRTSVRRCWIVS